MGACDPANGDLAKNLKKNRVGACFTVDENALQTHILGFVLSIHVLRSLA